MALISEVAELEGIELLEGLNAYLLVIISECE